MDMHEYEHILQTGSNQLLAYKQSIESKVSNVGVNWVGKVQYSNSSEALGHNYPMRGDEEVIWKQNLVIQSINPHQNLNDVKLHSEMDMHEYEHILQTGSNQLLAYKQSIESKVSNVDVNWVGKVYYSSLVEALGHSYPM